MNITPHNTIIAILRPISKMDSRTIKKIENENMAIIGKQSKTPKKDDIVKFLTNHMASISSYLDNETIQLIEKKSQEIYKRFIHAKIQHIFNTQNMLENFNKKFLNKTQQQYFEDALQHSENYHLSYFEFNSSESNFTQLLDTMNQYDYKTIGTIVVMCQMNKKHLNGKKYSIMWSDFIKAAKSDSEYDFILSPIQSCEMPFIINYVKSFDSRSIREKKYELDQKITSLLEDLSVEEMQILNKKLLEIKHKK